MEIVPDNVMVVDVGSGAGLPGIPLAIARPDLTVVLVDSLARRIAFLSEALDALGLGDRVSVVRGRAEDLAGTVPAAEVVTARAVAPLDRLAAWCLPLARVGGRLLALKGASAAEEIAEHTAAVARLGGGTPSVHRCGEGLLEEPTTVVEVVREQLARRHRPPVRGYRR
jgi:16S rRNA (guanine527-N7)-methyltransferase